MKYTVYDTFGDYTIDINLKQLSKLLKDTLIPKFSWFKIPRSEKDVEKTLQDLVDLTEPGQYNASYDEMEKFYDVHCEDMGDYFEKTGADDFVMEGMLAEAKKKDGIWFFLTDLHKIYITQSYLRFAASDILEKIDFAYKYR